MSNVFHLLLEESQIPCKGTYIEIIFFQQYRRYILK